MCFECNSALGIYATKHVDIKGKKAYWVGPLRSSFVVHHHRYENDVHKGNGFTLLGIYN